jgi:hypothetical protein
MVLTQDEVSYHAGASSSDLLAGALAA